MNIKEGVGAQEECKKGVQGVIKDSRVSQGLWPPSRGLPPALNGVEQIRSAHGKICLAYERTKPIMINLNTIFTKSALIIQNRASFILIRDEQN